MAKPSVLSILGSRMETVKETNARASAGVRISGSSSLIAPQYGTNGAQFTAVLVRNYIIPLDIAVLFLQ